MIYLVGVDHVFQHDGNVTRGPKELMPTYRDDFRNFIADVVKARKVDLITEEWCDPEHNQLVNATITEAKVLAKELGLRHSYIEPCGEDRSRLELPTSRYDDLHEDELRRIYDIREGYWLSQLERLSGVNPLHICGADHIRSFGTLLSSKGLENSVVEECWGAKLLASNHKYNKSGE